ncbi:hypothetical protein GCM10010347_61020 [Streptomyces cirratus]|uniref:Transposase n=1 Tax=Streptomyces cirratus TaxID=68187 RepID=A0ABQ3F462_9ACTN|nr:hypothetical protein GCM10010347_61020 [Streptomyces cirratus]
MPFGAGTGRVEAVGGSPPQRLHSRRRTGRAHGLFPALAAGRNVEQGQKSLSAVITAGRQGDSPQFEPVPEAIRVPRLGLGRPRKRPNRVRADKAYNSPAMTGPTCADSGSSPPSRCLRTGSATVRARIARRTHAEVAPALASMQHL